MEDLEAILAEYGSDEEGELNLPAGLNLEDILKEADDDDDDDVLTLTKVGNLDREPHGLVPLDSKDEPALFLGSAASQRHEEEGEVEEKASRDNEDWQQLQEILKAAEEEEDDEEDGDVAVPRHDIESIIASFETGGSEDPSSSDPDTPVLRSPLIAAIQAAVSAAPPTEPTPATVVTTSTSAAPSPVPPSLMPPPAKAPSSSSTSGATSAAPLASPSASTSRSSSSLQTSISKSLSTRPSMAALKGLELAEAKEQKFLRGGNRDVISPLQVKRRMRPKAPSSTKAEGAGGGGAGMVRAEVVDAITKQLDKNAKYVSHGPGVPTALAVHPKYIAIGTRKGLVLLFDHLHEVRNVLGTPAEADIDGAVTSLDISTTHDLLITGYTSGKLTLWDLTKGVALKAVTDAHRSPLTCVRFASCKDAAVISVDVLGNVNKLNFSKMLWGAYVVDTECLLDGKAGQIPAISILTRITFPPPASALDDGPSLAKNAGGSGGSGAALLAPLKAASSVVAVAAPPKPVHLSLIGLSSERNSFVVSVEPNVKVLYKWEKPPPEFSSGHHPSISWGWTPADTTITSSSSASSSQQPAKAPSLTGGGGGGPEAGLVPVMARCWGRKVQLLRVVVPRELPGGTVDASPLLSYQVAGEAVLSKTGVAVEWVGQSLLAVLDASSRLQVLDVSSLTPRDAVDVSAMSLLVLCFTPVGLMDAAPPSKPATGSKPPLETYQNSFRRCEGRLYLLGKKELRTVGLQSWDQRIEALVQSGEWLEALALALDHFEQHVLPTKASAADVAPPSSSVEAQIADLLLRYVRLAIENAPKGGTSALSRSHFQMLSGVAIEYCIVTQRLDLLYKDVFTCFVTSGQARLFLDMLEPYVLTDRLRHVAPEALASFIEHHVGRNDVASVERCLLHLNVSPDLVDHDHLLPLLKRHGMHTALCHVYSRGRADLLTPLRLLLQELILLAVDWLRKEREEEALVLEGSALEALGLKTLLFVSYCLQGRSFTSGRALSDTELTGLNWPPQRSGLVCLLLDPHPPRLPDDSCVPASDLAALGPSHAYLRLLLAINCRAVLDVMATAFDAEDLHFQDEGRDGDFSSPRRPDTPPRPSRPGGSTAPASSTGEGGNKLGLLPTACPAKESICHLLSTIVHGPPPPSPLLSRASSGEVSSLLLDFLAQYMERGHVSTRDTPLVHRVLRHLACRPTTAKLGADVAQERVTRLMQRIALDQLDVEGLLPLVKDLGFTRAELFLHEASYDRYLRHHHEGAVRAGDGTVHLGKAIRCYLSDRDPDFRAKVFEYMTGVVASVQQTVAAHPPPPSSSGKGGGQQGQAAEAPLLSELKKTILQEMAGLFQLDRPAFLRLTAPLFSGDAKAVLSALDARHDEELQFQYLQAVVNGELSPAGSGGVDSELPGGVSAMAASSSSAVLPLGPSELMLYVRLMAKYRPSDVYAYLKSHDDYPLDECLRICQQDRRLMDATAYLLERTGDVMGALQLLLVAISERAAALRAVIRRFNTKQFLALLTSLQTHGSTMHSPATGQALASLSAATAPPAITPALLRRKGLIRKVVLENMEEGRALEKMLHVALDLCQRNSGPRGAAPTDGSTAARYEEEVAKLWFDLLDRLLNENAATKQTALERATSDAPQTSVIMQAVMNELIQVSLDRMMGSVPLPDIVRKITTDHASNCLGDFRDILLNMFETYSYERNIYSTGVTLMTNTLYRLIRQKHRLRGAGKCVRAVEGVALPMSKEAASGSRRAGLMVPVPARDTRLRVTAEGVVAFRHASEDHQEVEAGRASAGRRESFST